MKTLFVYDTETTGVDGSARIVQFAGMFYRIGENGKKHEERSINQLIDPEIQIPAGASKVHGITNDMVKGFPKINDCIREFLVYQKKADLVIGHNLTFDMRMLRQEMERIGIDYNLNDNIFDTMKNSTDIVRIEGPMGYKRPKLIELHNFLFGKDFENAHDAMGDIHATLDCYFELKKKYGL